MGTRFDEARIAISMLLLLVLCCARLKDELVLRVLYFLRFECIVSCARSAAASSTNPVVHDDSDRLVLHHGAVPDGPASLRLRAKRGDVGINVVG